MEVQRPVTDGPATLVEGNSGTVLPGGWWRWDVLLCLVVSMVSAALLPLDDTDLPMHLRTGAWILEHGTVPFVEPFAWTRDGAPFYAYSWLPEVLYQLAWSKGGPWGLSLLHAVFVAGAVAALWDLARTACWSLWATRLVVSIHLILWLLVQPATRPQLMLAIALPLAWAGAIRLRDHSSVSNPWRGLIRVWFAALLAVNAHLFFLLTIVPGVVLLAANPVPWRNALLYVGATVLGWLCTPYALKLLDILRLYLSPNPLVGLASPITELENGFAVLMHSGIGTRILVGILLVLPLLPFMSSLRQRERWWYGMAWMAGLGLYGLALRGLLIWWLLALPLVAMAFASIPLPSLTLTKRLVVVGWMVSIVGLVGQGLTMRQKMPRVDILPHSESPALAKAVGVLSCLFQKDANSQPVRGTTVFNYGSYLTWRVPTVSWSVDGRSIFPDSVAMAEVRQELRHGSLVEPPWRSSELALLPPGHATIGHIAADSGWERVAFSPDTAASGAELWIRRSLARKHNECLLVGNSGGDASKP
ncbi:hypothetical protein GEMMAAP_15515 [Gemmatimonas phototrophica]|uniref:Glycosyltransferase RgtA/B/C/D-like domain-containing protein n=2 Tax=Gemmatimonas phototrophica TaxID=1379270 RepID=A0A143BMM5_9BACT|nr:hypothetical protein GEMMAAP_15515 [Gemmatimonas phototrophica]